MNKQQVQKIYETLERFYVKQAPVYFGTNFSSFSRFSEYVTQQLESWGKIQDLQFAKESFSNFSQIQSQISVIDSTEDAGTARDRLTSIRSTLTNGNCFNVDSTFIQYLIALNKEDVSMANQVYQHMTNDSGAFISDRMLRFYILDCYSAISRRSKFGESISVEKLEDSADAFFEKTTNLFFEFESRTSSTIRAIEKKLEETDSSVAAEVKKANDIFSEQLEKNRKDFSAARDAYEKLLSLQSPMGYWKAIEAKAKGSNLLWFVVAIIAVISLIATATIAYFTIPNLVVEPNKSYSITEIVKWFILTSLIISVEALVLRQALKIAFSSLHLARDAQERRTLAFMYLTLSKSGQVQDIEERKIILSALFSRAETGLLKGESAPTIPSTNFIGEIIRGK